MKKKPDLHTFFYFRVFLIFIGLLTMQVHADGIASVNSYVEIKNSALILEPENKATMVKDLLQDLTL